MKVGPKYLTDLGNWAEFSFIVFCYFNIYTLIFSEEIFKFYSKVVFLLLLSYL